MADRDQRFVEFVEIMGPRLRRTAYLVCGDWYRAEDAVQDAFCKLYFVWDQIDRDGNPVGYARRSVINATLDGAKRPWRREVPTAAVRSDSAPARNGDLATDHAARDEVVGVLRGLPPRQRACVVLRYYEDLSVEQTAEILGCSEGTVRSQCAKGLKALRQAIVSSRSTECVN